MFDQGHLVGAKAREHFPGGVLVDAHYSDFAGRVARTQAALAAQAPAIFEAAFFVDDIFVAVDVLERTDRGWTLVEVKSTAGVNQQHLSDAAIQTSVLRRSGLHVERVEIMHLNRECQFPDLQSLFVRADVTDEVFAMLADVIPEADAQSNMLEGRLPNVATGDHCETPYACPFQERCWPPPPEHHVRTLYRIGSRAKELVAQGIVTIHDVPDDARFSIVAERQRRSVQENRLIVESSLRDAQDAITYPYAVLDFETVQLAIPVWDGCRPYEQVPVQFSCHVVTPWNDVSHHAWLADGATDPRREIAARVVDACRGVEVVVAYNAVFEKTVLDQLAKAVPEQAEALAIHRGTVSGRPAARPRSPLPTCVWRQLQPQVGLARAGAGDGLRRTRDPERRCGKREAATPAVRQRCVACRPRTDASGTAAILRCRYPRRGSTPGTIEGTGPYRQPGKLTRR